MYCVKCGVELADTEKQCPLCHTRVYHPEVLQPAGEPLYPSGRVPANPKATKLLPILMTILSISTVLVVLLCDLQINREVTWSGIVIGALVTGYVGMILPVWFKKPNPVIFVPCFFGAVILYLLYLSVSTEGGWFMGFAFPVAGGIGLIVTALVTLLRYVRKGKLYTVGGALMAQGAFMLLVEFLLCRTFGRPLTGWSLYPLLALMLLGGYLIFLAICHPVREAMERKFFF